MNTVFRMPFAAAFAVAAFLPAQQPGAKTFASPEAACAALVAASKDNDPKALLAILGPGAQQLVSSGDPAEDARGRATFVQRYQEMHRLVKEPDGTTVLYIGAHNWPSPIPLVSKGDAWSFDTEKGAKEILARRIGRNELSTIKVCQELVAAQKEYFAGQHAYARTLGSAEGQHDGLYWKAGPSGSPSPIGPLVAAAAQGEDNGAPAPYRGYYFRTLSRQGPKAPGGAKVYLEKGRMTGGFAFLACPAEYRSSGVMTFLVNQDGVVYERDLGPDTAARVKAMQAYNPGPGWRKAD